jgi:Ca2+-binding EF-hand superfamily protein
MMNKIALGLTIVGTVAAQQSFSPVIPRWISADKHGYGYVLTNYWNGTYAYEGSMSFSWDFDYNCARSYFYSYSDYAWGESTYCQNVVTAYDSRYGCYSEDIGYINMESGIKNWTNDFTINWGSGFTDPVWGYDNYQVLEHKSEWTYIYQRPADRAIEFIVHANGNYDDVVYFPAGLTVDNTVNGVWDYALKYGQCPNNGTAFAFANLFGGKSLAHKPLTSKPDNLQAKPRATASQREGGVRSLFKSAATKSMVAAPNKATFLLNTVTAPHHNHNTFSLLSKMSMVSQKDVIAEAFDDVDENDDGCIDIDELRDEVLDENALATDAEITFIFRYLDTNGNGCINFNEFYTFATSNNLSSKKGLVSAALKNDKLAQVKSFLTTMASSNDDLAAQVDTVFALVDTNKDGFISSAELKAAIAVENPLVTDEEVKFVMAFIDANGDGLISWDELYNFAKAQEGQTLFTKAEKADIIMNHYDTNFTGYLEINEVKNLLRDAQGYATDADAQWFLFVVDTNTDNMISRSELIAIIQ